MDPSVTPSWRVLESPVDGEEPRPNVAAAAPTDPTRSDTVAGLARTIAVVDRSPVSWPSSPSGWRSRAAQATASSSTARRSARPAASPSAPGASATGEVVVEIVGAVVQPGVFHLPAGARIADLVAAAGGYGPRVDTTRVAIELRPRGRPGGRRPDPRPIARRSRRERGTGRFSTGCRHRRADRPQPRDGRGARHAAGHRAGHGRQDHRGAGRGAVRERGRAAGTRDPRREDVRARPRPRDRVLTCHAAHGWQRARPAPLSSSRRSAPGAPRHSSSASWRSRLPAGSCPVAPDGSRWARQSVPCSSRSACWCCLERRSRPCRRPARVRGRWSWRRWVRLATATRSRRFGRWPPSTDSILRLAATLPRYPEVRPGDRLEVSGRVRPRPDGGYGDYLARIGAAGTLDVDRSVVTGTDPGAMAVLEGLRRGAADALTAVLPSQRPGSPPASSSGFATASTARSRPRSRRRA